MYFWLLLLLNNLFWDGKSENLSLFFSFCHFWRQKLAKRCFCQVVLTAVKTTLAKTCEPWDSLNNWNWWLHCVFCHSYINSYIFVYLIFQTRILDWREGALDGKHLLRKLQIADWELERYESEAAPPNWTCSWNRYGQPVQFTIF